VQRVVADSERNTAETMALITQNAPLTIALAKAGAREVAKPDTERNFARLDAMVNACFDSRDYGKGRCSFTQKRRPNFKNE
jgi:enoyl-CoA hydratase/carnithine racemase